MRLIVFDIYLVAWLIDRQLKGAVEPLPGALAQTGRHTGGCFMFVVLPYFQTLYSLPGMMMPS